MHITDSWVCDGCKALMYLKDEQGYPIPGGPLPAYLDSEYQQVCQMCYEMYKTLARIDSSYWKEDGSEHKPYKPRGESK